MKIKKNLQKTNKIFTKLLIKNCIKLEKFHKISPQNKFTRDARKLCVITVGI